MSAQQLHSDEQLVAYMKALKEGTLGEGEQLLGGTKKKREIREEARLESVGRARTIYERYDVDRSGRLDIEEVHAALHDLGFVMGAEDAARLVRKFARTDPTALTEPEFYRLVATAHDFDARRGKRLRGCASHLPFFPHADKALKVYSNRYVQGVVAFLIVLNFLVNCYEKEIDPYPPKLQSHGPTWRAFDTFFNIAFLFEILLNIWSCGGPYKRFWYSGWNVFDFLVVIVGVVFMLDLLPPENPLSQLKMLRAFRVFRLFKRVKSLNKIITALVYAIPGVANAFVVMIIFMMIYSILAVEYFSSLGQMFGEHPYGTYVTYGDTSSPSNPSGIPEVHIIDASTDRGFTQGYEYYGTFTRALFTLFQVMTGDGWADLARPLMWGLDRNAVFVSIFFVTFILLTNIVLTNVVVAVLLDKFDSNDDNAEQEDGQQEVLDRFSERRPSRLSTDDMNELLGGEEANGDASLNEDADKTVRADKAADASLSAKNRRATVGFSMPLPASLPSPHTAEEDSYDSYGDIVTMADLDRKLNALIVAVDKLQSGAEKMQGGLNDVRGEIRFRNEMRARSNASLGNQRYSPPPNGVVRSYTAPRHHGESGLLATVDNLQRGLEASLEEVREEVRFRSALSA